MTQTIEVPADPAEVTADYARRIHWWVRLVGVLMLVSIAVSVGFGIFVGVRLSHGRANGTSFDVPAYVACLKAHTADYCLANS